MTWYAAKIGMFAIFVGLLYFTLSIVMNQVSSFIADNFSLGNNAIYILHKFKICEAVNVYISAVVGTWIANKIINYWM